VPVSPLAYTSAVCAAPTKALLSWQQSRPHAALASSALCLYSLKRRLEVCERACGGWQRQAEVGLPQSGGESFTDKLPIDWTNLSFAIDLHYSLGLLSYGYR